MQSVTARWHAARKGSPVMNAAFRIQPAPRPGVRVLVVHANAAERDRACTALGEDGFVVDGVANGVEAALRLADADRPRLVIAFSGVEEAVEILTAARGFAPPVGFILILPNADAAAERRARRLGITTIFSGPIDLDDLRTVAVNLAPR